MCSAKIVLKEDWDDSEHSINLFLEGDLANAANTTSKCQLEFVDATKLNNASMGYLRARIAHYLGVDDILTIQLESSTLKAKKKTFKTRGSICDRMNAIWSKVGYDDRNNAQEVFQRIKAPWLRVRKTEYCILAFPGLNLEVCITPSEVAVVGDIRKIAAGFFKSLLPRSFHVNIGGVELLEDAKELQGLDMPLRHKAVITCIQEVHECSICAEDVGFLDWPGAQNAKACDHASTTCTSCLRNWIGEALDNNIIDQITCPECEAVLEHGDVRKHATEEEFNR